MATLLLTAVGSAIGGPLGGAIGALFGQRVDQALLGPKGRQGARLADLSVQSSSYGASIPRIYGRMRVSGTVIWATDLREERRKVSQGKGRPKATVYSYSASFAVLLSGRPAGRIGRIWADGKLLRGVAGDFKVDTGFRFHGGAAGQPVDPLIASAEGISAPAYRGRAIAVFEDMALESFGNRIPLLSFEVIADDGSVAASDIICDIVGTDVLPRSDVTFAGFVADGASVGAALASLEPLVPLRQLDNGLSVDIGGLDTDPVSLSAGHLIGSPKPEITRLSEASLPARMSLGFADVDRDFQAGLQIVDLNMAGRSVQSDVPAAMPPSAAQKLVRDALLRSRLEGHIAEIRLPVRDLGLWVAGTVVIDGKVWRVCSIRLETMMLVVKLTPFSPGHSTPASADGGRATTELDLQAGETHLVLAELPHIQDVAATAPLLVAAAAGSGPGWRSAALLLQSDGQTEWQEAGRLPAPAVMGVATNGLAPASPHLFDLQNTLIVDVLHDGISFLNADDAALLAGANLTLVGGEVVQFGRAERLASCRWRLSRLLRGRRGSENMIGQHVAGEQVLVLDEDALLPVRVTAGTASVAALAKGVGDPHAVSASIMVSGTAIRPLAPAHLRCARELPGHLTIRWTRRSREGWQWVDAVDAPLSEERELYRATLSAGEMQVDFETQVPMLVIPDALLAEFTVPGAEHLTVSVVQIGRFGISATCSTAFPL